MKSYSLGNNLWRLANTPAFIELRTLEAHAVNIHPSCGCHLPTNGHVLKCTFMSRLGYLFLIN